MDVVAEWSNDVLEAQKSEICELLKTQLKDESIWYLIDVRWFKQWKKFVGYDEWETTMVGERTANPGPIDNSMLFSDNDGTKTLKENLTDDIDYTLAPKAAWDKLLSWYGLQAGQEPLERRVIQHGVFIKHHKVEVYYLHLHLTSFADLSRVVTRQFSHADTIADLERVIREEFAIPTDRNIHLWNCYVNNTYEPLTRSVNDNTLQDAGLYTGQTVVVEVRNEDGSWPQPRNNRLNTTYITRGITNTVTTATNNTLSTAGPISAAVSSNSIRQHSSASCNNTPYYDGCHGSVAPGLCGLGNLGNTCFMNSAIQCLSNVSLLTRYMVSDSWKQELNLNNPLGMHGEIARSYAELIKNMWSGKYSYTIPRHFKIAVGRFKPEFSGYQQQDSQELMAFLLDGLHEDLNRIIQKPYIETKEANNRPDKEVAQEAWSDYIKRNDSVIVDIFHGLLKSTLVCPQCSKVSVKFDPFCYLSLPLPVKRERQIEIILVPWDPTRKFRQYKVTVLKTGVITQLCIALSQLTDIAPEKMLVVDVYNHRFHRIFSPNDALTTILERDDIFVYELPSELMDDESVRLIPVYMRLDRSRLFGMPTVIAVRSKVCTYDTLYNCILDRMERIIRRPDLNQRRAQAGTQNDMDSDQLSVEDDTEDGSHSSQSNTDKNELKSSESGGSSEEVDDSIANDDDDDDDDISDCNALPLAISQQPRLFTLSIVNIYGTAEVVRLADDNKQINFDAQHVFLAADWSNKSCQLFYDEKRAEDLEVDDSMSARPVPKKQCIQLAECLDLFTTNELLGEHDLWFCPVCKRHEQATKKFDIWKLPHILVIHLKRFSYTRYWRDKLDTLVDFPIRGLDMSPWVINRDHEPAVYDLIAVSNHYGGMGGGHYTAHAKNHRDGAWYHFDDSTVSSTTEASIVTKAAYVLVYERRTDHKVTTTTDRLTSDPVTSTATASDNCITSLDSDDDDNDDNSSSGPMETS